MLHPILEENLKPKTGNPLLLSLQMIDDPLKPVAMKAVECK